MGNYVEIDIELGRSSSSSRAKKIGPQSGLVIARLGARIPPYVTNPDNYLSSTTQIVLLIPLLFVCSLCYANLTSLGYSLGLKLHELAGRCCGGLISAV
ncbi:hypothetical protein N7527_000629 [Penicillium freii]|nr:hypothetical protein N7527_000629 [Penicillium freii]